MNIVKLFSFLIIFQACSADTPPPSISTNITIPQKAPAELIPPLDTSRENHFAWKKDYHPKDLLLNRIAPPPGFYRGEEPSGSYADWLRHLPVKAANTPVLLHNGQQKGRQDVHAAVVDIDVGRADLQQCADAVMRLRAEYFYSKDDFAEIHFNYTSGDKVSFDDWRQGRRPKVSGNQVRFSPKNGTSDNSYRNFKKYLTEIFKYAGTASLSKELKKVKVEEMQIGDVFIHGGFPGHAILVIDMAINSSGEKRFLLAQSYMPAQNIHILKNPSDAAISPWYNIHFGEILNTPEWTFNREELRRH